MDALDSSWFVYSVWVSAIVVALYIGANRGHTSRWWVVFFFMVPPASFIAIPLWLAFEKPVRPPKGTSALSPR
jgi:hypothetical protein